MGYGEYASDAHRAITSTRARKPVAEVFKERSTAEPMNPYGVKVRESRDSSMHPESLGVAFVLDVTGSMGDIPPDVAQKELPEFMQMMGDLGVAHPQIMFAAVGDAAPNGNYNCADRSPLQVGQFESEAQLMDKWITAVHLERGGGGGGNESYELGAYFFARHTAMDCWEKRGKKGYFFMTGDEKPYEHVAPRQVLELIGDRIGEPIPTADIFAELREKYHVFFLMPRNINSPRAARTWRGYLGDHAIELTAPETANDVCLTAAVIISVNEGIYPTLIAAADALISQGVDRKRVSHVVKALTPWAAALGRDGNPQPAVEPEAVASRSASRRS